MSPIRQPDIITHPDALKKERAIAEALREYRRAEFEHAAPLPRAGILTGHWKGFATGVAAALAVVWILWPQVQPLPARRTGSELAVFHEMQALFGKQLTGVLLQGNTVQPVLSSNGEAFTRSEPILITLQQGSTTTRILCYSGNTISVPVQGRNITLNAYTDAKGNVVVEGQDFLWSQGKTLGTAPTSLNARTIGEDL